MKESYFGSHKGFTLAEVLVTLGIIGVVSAMTVPTLMQNYQRQSYVTQLHKVYNEFSQAAERYKNDNNYLNLSESRVRGNADELKRFFNSYFKVVKDCEIVELDILLVLQVSIGLCQGQQIKHQTDNVMS